MSTLNEKPLSENRLRLLAATGTLLAVIWTVLSLVVLPGLPWCKGPTESGMIGFCFGFSHSFYVTLLAATVLLWIVSEV